MSKTGKMQELDLTQTLPYALTLDEHSVAFAKALAVGLRENAELAKEAGIYYRIEELPEATLDMLATDLHVDWYNPDADLEEKRKVIASSIFVHRHMGTPAAIQRVLDDDFGSGSVLEWFDYGGEHHHFKVTTENIDLVYQNIDHFMTLLSKAKKASAVLDSVSMDRTCEAHIGTGLASRVRLEYTNTMAEADISGYTWLADQDENLLTDGNGSVLLYE